MRRLRLLNKRRYSTSAEIIPRDLHSKALIPRQSYLCWRRCFQERTSRTCHELFPGPFGLLDVIKSVLVFFLPKTALPLIKTDVVQSILLGSVCRTFLFFPGLSFRFLNATSLPAPSERKVILGVERSLNLTSFGTDSPVGACFSSLPFDEFSFFLETERIK